MHATRIIKARKTYQHKFSQFQASTEGMMNLTEFYHFITCYAYFELLTVDIQRMSTIFEEGLKVISDIVDRENQEIVNEEEATFIFEQMFETYVRTIFYIQRNLKLLEAIYGNKSSSICINSIRMSLTQ